MNEDLILKFFKDYPKISYKSGEKILRPHEYANHVYLVTEGFVRFYKVLKTGQEITIGRYNPQKQKSLLFGHLSLFSPFSYYVEALTDVCLYRAPKPELDKFVSQNPQVKDYVIENLKMIVEELIQQVEMLSIPDAYTRLKALIYFIAQKVGVKKGKNKLIIVSKYPYKSRLTHNLLASFCGLSRETVSIQMNRLIDEGYLSKENNSLVIENVDKLLEDIS